MGNLTKTKLLTNLIVVVAVLVIGAGVVMAARGGSIVPFSSSSGDAHSAQATETEQQDQNEQNEFKAHGMIQTITFDQGTTTSGSLDFLPDGQPATVTVDFTAQTHVQVTGGLQTNVAVRIEGTKQSDGSVMAKEISDNAEANDENNNDQEDQTVPGVIQSLDMTAQTFVFLPDGQSATMTIAFDQHTNVEDGQKLAQLTAGEHVVVEIVKRADGTLYAKEIKNGQEDGHDGSGGDDGGDNSGSGSGSGSGGSGSGSGSGGSGSGGSGGSGGSDDGGH